MLWLRLHREEVLMTHNSQFLDQPVASADLRNVLANYLTGVTIVTTVGPDKKPYGLTVTSFNSVSLSPPLVLWSLDNRNDRLSMFKGAKGFAVNIMAGVAAVVKPSEYTSYLTALMVEEIIKSKILPEGSLQLIPGLGRGILDHVDHRDVVTFTGSAATGRKLKSHPNIIENSI